MKKEMKEILTMDNFFKLNSKYEVEKHLDWVMSSHGLMSPKHQPSKDHTPAVLFKGFVELLVHNAIIKYFENGYPTFGDEGEANYYGDELFLNIGSLKVNDQIDLKILYFKRSLVHLLEGNYIDIEVLAAEPFNIKYAVAIKLINLGLITDKRTINKIKSGDVSLNIITRVLEQESFVDEVHLRECLTMLKQLASFTK